MATITAEEVVVDLLARTDKLERALVQAGQTVDQRLNGMEARGAAFAGKFTGLLAGVSAGALVAELGKLADQSKQLDAQLKLATASFGSFGQAQADVRRLADQTRGSLDATTKLYAGFVRAAQETDRSQSDAARATQTFAEALKIGGAGAAEAASATLQFNQALQSGVLRGDEFNSILEASPRIARLLADALGVPIGQLRSMAEEGKITSDVLFQALTSRKFTAGIDAEFKQLPTTFGDAMQAIENAALVTFGAFDKGGQFSNALTNMLTEGTASFAGLEQAAEKYGTVNRSVIDGLVSTFQALKSEAEATANATSDQFAAMSSSLSTAFNPLGANATTVFSSVRREADYTTATIANLLSGIDQLRNFLPDLQRRAQAFDEKTFGRRLGFTGDLGPRSELSGQFRQSVARSRIDAATARGGRVTAGVAVSAPARAAGSSDDKGGKAGKKRVGGASQAERDAAKVERDLNGVIAAVRRAAADDSGFDKLGRSASETQRERDNFNQDRFRRVFGREGQDYENPFGGVEDYDRQLGERLDAELEVERQAQDVREANMLQLADTFEDLFVGGTDAVWKNFERQGLRALAIILAQSAIKSFGQGGNGVGGFFGNLASGLGAVFGGGGTSGLPRLANGGTITAGGMGGVDRNVLSVNGVPRAMISANETLSVINPGLMSAMANVRATQPAPRFTIIAPQQFDLRGVMMTEAVLSQMEARNRDYADQVAASASKQALQLGPTYAAKRQQMTG